jgi:hypothetical protein
MNSEAVEKPGYSGSRPSMDHAQMHEEITTPLVLAGKLVLDLAEDGTPLLLLVVSSGSNALAARSALGRHIRVFPEILGGFWGGEAAASLGGSRRARLGLGCGSLYAGCDSWLGLFGRRWLFGRKRDIGVRVNGLRRCLVDRRGVGLNSLGRSRFSRRGIRVNGLG